MLAGPKEEKLGWTPHWSFVCAKVNRATKDAPMPVHHDRKLKPMQLVLSVNDDRATSPKRIVYRQQPSTQKGKSEMPLLELFDLHGRVSL